MFNLYEFYQNLLSLTQKQKEAIIEEDFERLLKILEKKQQVIDKIDEIDVNEYLSKHINPEDALKNLKELMIKTKKLEEDNVKELKEKYKNIGGQLKDINLKAKTRHGYQVNKRYEAKFIDKKG
jgi:hypothetical protein